jgi:hypothetical protein
MFPKWLRWLLYTAALALLAPLLGLALIVETRPAIAPEEHPAQHYLSRTRNLLHNTVQAPPDDQDRRRLVLTAEDLKAAANFVLLRKKLEGYADCLIKDGRLSLNAAIRLPVRLIPLFLNIRVMAEDAEPQAVIDRVRVGRLTLPRPLVRWLLRTAVNHTPLLRYSLIGDQLVKDVRLRGEVLQFTLNWNRDVLDRAKGWITDLADKERLLVYHDKLAEVVGRSGLKRFVRLSSLMQPLFALAKSRSENANDPVEENRALIVVLSAYVNGRQITGWLPARRPASELPQRRVLLHRRVDTAQHFMASAALAMSGHSALTDMLGLAKELNDAHDGSGFSFIDLAADQTGAAFGKTAVRSGDKARRMQNALGRSANESLFMPEIKDLPENLGPMDFAVRFKDIESPEFKAMKQLIEERIAALEIYRPE